MRALLFTTGLTAVILVFTGVSWLIWRHDDPAPKRKVDVKKTPHGLEVYNLVIAHYISGFNKRGEPNSLFSASSLRQIRDLTPNAIVLKDEDERENPAFRQALRNLPRGQRRVEG